MEKSMSQKVLKVISIIMIVVGAIAIVISAMMLVGGIAAVNYGTVPDVSPEDAETVTVVAIGLGIMGIISGIVNVVIGIFGVRGANNPQKIGVFFVLCIVGLVLMAINTVYQFATGAVDSSGVISAFLGYVCPVIVTMLAHNVKKENGL